jgi:hypothetical protein
MGRWWMGCTASEGTRTGWPGNRKNLPMILEKSMKSLSFREGRTSKHHLLMKTIFANILVTLLLLCIIFSCKRENNNSDKQTLNNVGEIFKEVSEKHKTYFDLAPIELPSYIVESDDTIKQEIVQLAAFFDSSKVKSVDLTLPDSFTLKSASSDDDTKPVRECFDVPNMSYCEYTWFENDGKLKVTFTDAAYNDTWSSTLMYDGEDTDGTTYNEEFIETWDIFKDLSYSVFCYFSKFYLCDEETQLLWQFENWVEGDDAWLHFDGESKSLATYYYQVTNYICEPNPDGHHINGVKFMVNYPDDSFNFKTYIYSYGIHQVYLWIDYWCSTDESWSKTVYDDEGNIVDYQSSLD